jgi:2-amino-4-hydroxy-6-hydroxymethyldihydropteridine diphosphokinase
LIEAVYIGLGSNLNHPQGQVKRAIEAIAQFPETTLVQSSSLYRTKPWGGVPQDDFVNAVVHIKTTLSAQMLLKQLLVLEKKHEREQTARWGPRTLDCDILLYGKQVIFEHDLIVPHPHMHQRAFVLVPLIEIAPHFAFLLKTSETGEIVPL